MTLYCLFWKKNNYELNYSNTRFAKRKDLEKARDISIGSIFQKIVTSSEKTIKTLDEQKDKRMIEALKKQNCSSKVGN